MAFRTLSVVFFTLAALSSGGCASVSTPRTRVAADLGCSAEETRVELIEDVPGNPAARWRVTGCGRTAVYLCTAPVRDCWREDQIVGESEGNRP